MEMPNASLDIMTNSTMATSVPGMPSSPGSYFALERLSSHMFAHIALMTIGWFFVLPIGVMLSIARSRLAILAHMIFLGFDGAGLLLGAIYNSKTPDLYERNLHHKFGWAVAWIVLVQLFLGLARRSAETHGKACSTPLAHYEKLSHYEDEESHRYSHDSDQGTEPNSPRSSSQSTLHEEPLGNEDERDVLNSKNERDHSKENSFYAYRASLWSYFLLAITTRRVISIIEAFHVAIERTILVLGFAAFASGFVTYGGIFRGDHIYNGMAHFVKGGIFFWYGLFSLGRCMGSFADLGWAWNIKPPASIVGARKARTPSAEFLESFLIFVYGATNVFMEHIAAWGGAWSAQDYEHVSISIMFFGGGLCGMLIESKRIRVWLNAACRTPMSAIGRAAPPIYWQEPRAYDFPMNPIPGLIILLLGLMMSSHHQNSEVSTTIHKQWGTLFVGAALARGVTYLLTYLSPPTSLLPSRPPTEFITSFCLISGGLLFMASNKDTVAAMETHNLNAMFTFTVVMGLTAFLMSWTILALAVKGWGMPRQERTMDHVGQPMA